MLAIAALVTGAAVVPTYAQDAAAAGGAQAGDPEAAANEAYKAWKAEADPAKKFALGKDLVSKHFGTKAAEAVAYEHMFKSPTTEVGNGWKYEISKAYYEASKAAGKPGQYGEYALGNLATMEKDLAKVMEYGRDYMQTYPAPAAKFTDFVKAAMENARYQSFLAAVKEKRYPEAITIADQAFAANENEFLYAYVLADAGLIDETASGATSKFVGKVSAWSDRGIRFVESGKMPAKADTAKWEKDKPTTLARLYKAKGVDTYLRVAGSNPTTIEALQPAIDELKRSITKNEKDAALYYFLSLAYSQQYGIESNAYDKLTDEEKLADPGKAQLEKVKVAADMVIDSYIKVIAFAGEASPVATDIKPKLQELWQFRHPDAPNQWQDEIKKVNGGAAAPSK